MNSPKSLSGVCVCKSDRGIHTYDGSGVLRNEEVDEEESDSGERASKELGEGGHR